MNKYMAITVTLIHIAREKMCIFASAMHLKNYINITITLLLTIVYLLSATGVQVFHHHCNTQQTTETSLFIPSFSCEHHHEQSCVTHGRMSCCIDENEETDAGCCNTTAEFIKLDFPQISVNSKIQITNENLAVITSIFIQKLTFLEEESLCSSFIHKPPLIISGKQKRIQHHQLKIAPSLA
jgi:hypothetical protein